MSRFGPRSSRRRGKRLAALAWWAVVGAVGATMPAGAQPVPVPVAAHTVRAAPDSSIAGPFVLASFEAEARQPAEAVRTGRRAPMWAAAASAVVPGAGQALLRQPHGIVYAAIEAYMWLAARDARHLSNQRRDEYRGIARTVARRDAPGSKPDGDWDYYERLEKLCKSTLTFNTRCSSSGLFDRVPGGEIDPETDLTTYNGQIWGEAVRTFTTVGVAPAKGTVQYQRALDEYARRAEKPEYYWSWVNQQQQQDVYRQAIQTANEKYNEYRRDHGVIIANHVLSMVDAFITVRVRRYGRPGVARERRTGFEASLPWGPFGRPRRAR
jgi:hypothetical protein